MSAEELQKVRQCPATGGPRETVILASFPRDLIIIIALRRGPSFRDSLGHWVRERVTEKKGDMR